MNDSTRSQLYLLAALLFCYLSRETPAGTLYPSKGAWFKEPSEVLRGLQDKSLNLDFAILKYGIITPSGGIKPYAGLSKLPSLCPKRPHLIAWLTRRLNLRESLSEKTAAELAGTLNDELKTMCFSGIELDIEQLPNLPPWYKKFCRRMRLTLDRKYSVRVAIPFLSKKIISATAWLPTAAADLIEDVDGLDIMVYDTGAKDTASYTDFVKDNLNEALMLVAKNPGKTIVLGFPSYPDKTSLHSPHIENLAVVANALASLPKTDEYKHRICSHQVRFAYYAGWTMSLDDKRSAQTIHQWQKSFCRK